MRGLFSDCVYALDTQLNIYINNQKVDFLIHDSFKISLCQISTSAKLECIFFYYDGKHLNIITFALWFQDENPFATVRTH